MPPNTVKVDRTTRWGNPYQVTVFGRERAIQLFEDTITGFWSHGRFADREPDHLVDKAYAIHRQLQQRVPSCLGHFVRRELRGKNLACWCKPGEPCHAAVLLKLANDPQAA
jgi:hypothetical protein